MKKVIKLTESDIHRIVKNSVKRILSELDWKTYANAAGKRAKQGKLQNTYDLDRAAENALNDKYQDSRFHFKTNIGQGNDYQDIRHYLRNDPSYDPWEGEYTKKQSTYLAPYGDSTIKPYSSTEDGIETPSTLFNSATDDLNDYTHGRSKYTKGKGWE